MGKFSGILLCSDFDGTLFDGEKIPQNNIEAIKYFRENGGLFTVITGRDYDFLPPFFEGIDLGVPFINLNGSLFYDPIKKQTVKDFFMEGMTKELVLRAFENTPEAVRISLLPSVGRQRYFRGEEQSIPEEYCLKTRKVVFYTDKNVSQEVSDRALENVRAVLGDRFSVERSASFVIEVMDRRLTKSHAARILASEVGAHTLISVGDYENDIDMIVEADIGYAVANAHESVKAAADRVTVSAREGAIAAIIYELDRELNK